MAIKKGKRMKDTANTISMIGERLSAFLQTKVLLGELTVEEAKKIYNSKMDDFLKMSGDELNQLVLRV